MAKYMTATELLQALYPLGFRDIQNLDSAYFCPARDWLDDFAKWLAPRRKPYMAEKFDCDNFARWAAAAADEALFANPTVTRCGHTFGEASCLIKTGDGAMQAHALNLCLCDNGQFYVFEPQTGDIQPIYKFVGSWTRLRI